MTPIIWRKRDIKKLQTYVRKFNAAITRFEKAHPEYSGWQIPERLSMDTLKKRIKTRSEFNYNIAKIDRFFRKGARDLVQYNGLWITKWQKREIQIMQQREKARIDALKKQYSSSPSVNLQAGLYQKAPETKLKDINKQLNRKDVINNYTEQDAIQSWQNFLHELERRGSESFSDDFKFKIFNAYKKGVRTIYTEEQADIILAKLDEYEITPQELLVMRQRWDIFDNDYVYGPEEQDEKFETTLLYFDLAVKELRQ